MGRKRLILVGWDSADWKIIHPLIDAGRLPGVRRLVEQGVSGNLATLEPQLSPMLWTSIATGKMAYSHGVAGFTEVDSESGQVVPVSAASRRCQTIWEILGKRGLRSHVLGWFATQGEQNLNGLMVSNLFCHLPPSATKLSPSEWPEPAAGTYWPPNLAEQFNELRVSPHELNPDQVLRLFVPEGHKIDQAKDQRLWFLAQRLAEAFSVQAAATAAMARDPDWDFLAIYYRAIDEISHVFMPYYPPQMAGVAEEDFILYRGVVEGAYRLHDLFLQRLLHLAGPDAAVILVSDHGFHSDHLRPMFVPQIPAGITVWHRPMGVFMAQGPGFKSDSLVFGARLLDVTPTILHYFGLPVGADMEGRALEEAFAERRPLLTVPTWENPESPRAPRPRISGGERQALLDQFAALGYIDEIPADSEQAAEETRRENDWNMARACVYGGRHAMALPLLESCFHARPDRTDYAQVLAHCQFKLGLLDAAELTALRAVASFGRSDGAKLLLASIALQKHDQAGALALLQGMKEADPEEIPFQLLLGQSYLRLRRWEEAETAARKILRGDPHNPEAHLILARLQFHQDKLEAAAESALEAIGFQYGNPLGHLLLGAALAGQARWEQAKKPLLNSIQLGPNDPRPYRLLSRIYRALGQMEEARTCELQGRITFERWRHRQAAQAVALRQGMTERSAARAAAAERLKQEGERKVAEAAAVTPGEFVLVSGLPRSGTSLMMQILQAGGLTVMTDGRRQPDEDNPEGYWEWEEVKQLPRNPQVLLKAKGKVIKVIGALLPYLPPQHRYKIVYMKRPVEQVVASQWKMLERRGAQPKAERAHLIAVQQQHTDAMLRSIRQHRQVDLLEVSFPELVGAPEPVLARLAEFLPEQFRAGPAVAASIKPALFRNR